jgi:hypothetical protein
MRWPFWTICKAAMLHRIGCSEDAMLMLRRVEATGAVFEAKFMLPWNFF